MGSSHLVASVDNANLLKIIEIQTEVVQEGINFSNIMFLVADRAQRVTDSDGSVIELKEDDEMVYRATSGLADPQLGLRLKAKGSLSGLCIEQREPLCCYDSETDLRVDRMACRVVGLRSMIVTPLMHNDEAVGVLKVLSRNINHYNEEQVQILTLLSRLIGAAMYTAEQYGQEELFIKATTDGMTGIRNRSMFFELLNARLAKEKKVEERFGIIMVDMDNLKKLNDAYGHKVGDAGILAIVDRIKSVIRGSDVFCRLGGDEFGIIVEKMSCKEDMQILLDRIRDYVNSEMLFENRRYELGVSLGYSIYGDDGVDLKELLDIADMRMYGEKKKKKIGFVANADLNFTHGMILPVSDEQA